MDMMLWGYGAGGYVAVVLFWIGIGAVVAIQLIRLSNAAIRWLDRH